MKKPFLIACITLFLGFTAIAQNSDDYNKNEFFVGYVVSERYPSGTNFRGFEVAYVRNIHKYVGIKADVLSTFNFGPGKNLTTTLNFLGGVQVKDNSSENNTKPFGYVLVGIARLKVKNPLDSSPDFSNTGFATNVGAGLDFKINKKISISGHIFGSYQGVSLYRRNGLSGEPRLNYYGAVIGVVFKK